MGVRPLYYGENTIAAALASERKALWKIGIERTRSFPPGYVSVADQQGFRFTETKKLSYSAPKPITIQAAARQLQTLLKKSTQKRVDGLKEVAVAFSGGLDSTIIAALTKNTGIALTLIHASLTRQPETQHAKQIAEELKIPIETCEFNENDVEKVLPNVLWATEESDPIDISIGTPIYWTAEKASEKGFSVLLAGQGADELFGGYKRYVDSYLTHGAEKTRKEMFGDVVKLYETDIERDYKICSRHDVELRLPFATYEIAKFAESLPINLKLEPKMTTLRKLVLRRVAEDLGLSMSVTTKPKKAIQYTTGVSKALKKIAKRHHLTIRDYLESLFQATCRKMMLNG
jgi:asparagine synthase (glutamine-hydrolysing)